MRDSDGGYETSVGGDSWQTMTTRAGVILGKTRQADQLVTRTQRAIVAARRANPELAGKTFTFGPVSGMNAVYTISSSADASAAFFAQLGMKLSPKVTSLPQSSTPHRAKVSSEQLDLLDADVMILTFPSRTLQSQFEDQPLFKQIPAVRRGSYVALDFDTAIAVGFPSVLSIPYGLRRTVPKLVAAARNA